MSYLRTYRTAFRVILHMHAADTWQPDEDQQVQWWFFLLTLAISLKMFSKGIYITEVNQGQLVLLLML